jgi:hypothetical protein
MMHDALLQCLHLAVDSQSNNMNVTHVVYSSFPQRKRLEKALKQKYSQASLGALSRSAQETRCYSCGVTIPSYADDSRLLAPHSNDVLIC